ncbi:hypothetical protein NA57DRAFT_78347 [Rhizodiscina lignyota]|uniref:Uncharacterized protein n=1 Tax=Rhizodiscina lignyota TaxID=1504668 RepID=A0A9P4IDW3_9PEZI|nr:hypothetical protein NA57DRAFT_78347 [Rhizodiscina lignyota]
MNRYRNHYAEPAMYVIADPAQPGRELQINEHEFGRAECAHLRAQGYCNACYAIMSSHDPTRPHYCGNPLGCSGHADPAEVCVTKHGLHLYAQRIYLRVSRSQFHVDMADPREAVELVQCRDPQLAAWIVAHCDHHMIRDVDRAIHDQRLWGTASDIARIQAMSGQTPTAHGQHEGLGGINHPRRPYIPGQALMERPPESHANGATGGMGQMVMRNPFPPPERVGGGSDMEGMGQMAMRAPSSQSERVGNGSGRGGMGQMVMRTPFPPLGRGGVGHGTDLMRYPDPRGRGLGMQVERYGNQPPSHNEPAPESETFGGPPGMPTGGGYRPRRRGSIGGLW